LSSSKHHIVYFTVLNFIVFPNIAFTIAKTRPASQLTFVTSFGARGDIGDCHL
jgi:hypothetical protein